MARTKKPSRRGAQASPTYRRTYVCEVCGKTKIQRGPGRGRRTCALATCLRKAKQRRRIPVSL